MNDKLARPIALVIAVLTMLAGAGQLIMPARALEGLGMTADSSSIFAFRLASLMIICFGALLYHDVKKVGMNGRGALWTGVQKAGAALLLGITLLTSGGEPLAWGVVVWDGFCAIFLLLAPHIGQAPAGEE